MLEDQDDTEQACGIPLNQLIIGLKKNKIISSVANGIGSVWAPAKAIGTAAGVLGYGRRRVGRPRVRRRVMGGSLRSVLSSVHRFVKDRKLVSGALNHFNHPKLAGIASSLGYGRRRRPVRRRVYRGGALTDQMGAVRF